MNSYNYFCIYHSSRNSRKGKWHICEKYNTDITTQILCCHILAHGHRLANSQFPKSEVPEDLISFTDLIVWTHLPKLKKKNSYFYRSMRP